MKFHGNSKKNDLYVIFDEQENEAFKYGISCDLIEKDGLSERTREQLILMNLAAGSERYSAWILQARIPGRAKALEIEDEHIAAFLRRHGRQPRCNRKKLKIKK